MLPQVNNDLDLLDHRINLLLSDLRKLYCERNSKVSISRLPQEILLHIFLLLSRDPMIYIPEEPPKRWDWLIVTKICSHWRTAALGCSSLWTNIDRFSQSDKIAAFLERSGRAIIDVKVKVETNQTILKCLEGHAPRTRRLSMVLDSEFDAWEELRNIIYSLTNCTRILSLRRFRQDQTSHTWDLPETHPVARLDKIYLSGVSMPLTCWLFSQLSELTLRDICDDCRPSVPDLLLALRRCPNLQHLALYDAGPLPLSQASNEVFFVQLPMLRYIELGGIEFSICSRLLEYAKVPKGLEWRISCKDFSFREPQVFNPDFLVKDGTNGILEIIINNYLLKITADKKVNGDDDDTQAYAQLQLQGFNIEYFEDLSTPINALLLNLTHPFWRNVTHFQFYFTDDLRDALLKDLHRERFVQIFDSLSVKVEFLYFYLPEELDIEIELVYAFIRPNPTQEEDHEVRFPNLKALRIYGATFDGTEGRKAYKILERHVRAMADHICELYYGPL